ncbi:neuroblast differentiation-associated protein AHNAK isoform X2 [Ursus maritimus]|uniref:Neuroblast differentiation-associated protein AHNAK isoform X2 n=1 Tax=Ursus maritimus TaxID=29073 RepID=A0A8M1GK81_URSMA|nr:neuroblast differentiation-associated protein AHNAK isoform X3 [Ursus arctos]XP_040495162.1 neuroblast differentiation-associated protein AHNAK isoform X2 [Ursus maritimus]
MEKEEDTTRELLLPNWQGSGSHGLTIAQRDDGVFVQEVMQNSPAARTGVVKEGDQIVGATIYFDNLQSGEVTQLLNTMGHHTVGLKLHRKGDRSPEPGQTWTHEVFSSRSSEVVLNTSQPPAVECKDQNKPEETISCVGALSVSTPNADGWQEAFCSSIFRTRLPGPPSPGAKTRWLKQQSLIFSQFWRPDVQGQGLGRADVLRPVSSAYG